MAKAVWWSKPIKVTEEAEKQYATVGTELDKLAKLSGRGWHILTDSAYKREMTGSALIGATGLAAVIGITKLV